MGDFEHDRGRSRDRDMEYDRVESKHERDRHGERDYDHGDREDDRGWYEHPEHYDHRRGYAEGDRDRYNQYPENDQDRYYQMEEDDYHYDRAKSESREREKAQDLDREYRRSDRSLSR